jgi:hypothetical protein
MTSLSNQKKVNTMKYKILFIAMHVVLLTQAQRSYKSENSLGNPILADSASTLFIPVLYNEALLSSNKIALIGGYYANLVVYNFVTDSYKRLFPKDTYIQFARLSEGMKFGYVNTNTSIVRVNRIFLLVKDKDTNRSGRIDENDASVLYTVTPDGENLKSLTTGEQNLVSIEVFDHAAFAVIQFQIDTNKDGNFNYRDTEHYYRKLDLKTLKWGREISLD